VLKVRIQSAVALFAFNGALKRTGYLVDIYGK